MTRTAVLIPADLAESHREITWETEAEAEKVIRAAVGCDYLDMVRLETTVGDFILLMDEEAGLRGGTPNRRAGSTIRSLVGQDPMLLGNVVFCGTPTPGGDIGGLTADQLATLEGAMILHDRLP